jgi:hypothetical protein
MLGLGPPAQLARSPTARAANVKPSGFIGAVISFPLHRRAVCEFRFLQRSSTSVRAKGPGTTPAVAFYRESDAEAYELQVLRLPDSHPGPAPPGDAGRRGQLADSRGGKRAWMPAEPSGRTPATRGVGVLARSLVGLQITQLIQNDNYYWKGCFESDHQPSQPEIGALRRSRLEKDPIVY